jgi:hypothetical protein
MAPTTTDRRDTVAHLLGADGVERGYIIPGCNTLNNVAHAPSYGYDLANVLWCNDCRRRVDMYGRGHAASCWWVVAVEHVLEHRCAPAATRAQLRALLAGWRLVDGGRR